MKALCSFLEQNKRINPLKKFIFIGSEEEGVLEKSKENRRLPG